MTRSNSSIEAEYYEKNCKVICKKYRGKWIAILGEKVIASGKGISVLYQSLSNEHQTPLIMYIPETEVQLL